MNPSLRSRHVYIVTSGEVPTTLLPNWHQVTLPTCMLPTALLPTCMLPTTLLPTCMLPNWHEVKLPTCCPRDYSHVPAAHVLPNWHEVQLPT